MGYDGSVVFDTKLDQSGLEKGLSNLGSNVVKGIAAAVTAATAAIAVAGKEIIKVGSDFESVISNLSAITGMSADEMSQVKDGIRSIATETGKSASDIAFSARMVAEAGGDINLMMAQFALD